MSEEDGNPVADAVGPVHTGDAVAGLLGVRLADLESLREDGQVLGARTRDGAWVYPAWQFDGGHIRTDLADAIQALRDAPHWSSCLWFNTPNPDLDDATPLAWLDGGSDPEAVTASARQTARAWR